MKNDLLSKTITKKDAYLLPEESDGTIFLSGVSDVMFKIMFNNTKRKKYPSYLLSLILNKDYKEILDNIEFSKDNLDSETYHMKGETVDLVCKIEDDYYNVEMNNNTTKEKLERNLDYLYRIYGEKAKKGKDYSYNSCLQININNFNFEGNEKEIMKFEIKNEEGIILTKKIKIIYIFLPLIKKKYYNKEKLSELEKYLLVINERERKDIEEFTKGSEIMEEYRCEAEEASHDTKVVGLYNKEQEMERVRLAELERVKKETFEEGIQCGIEQGTKQKQLEIVTKMLEKNISDDLIMSIIDIDKNELEKMKKIIKK